MQLVNPGKETLKPKKQTVHQQRAQKQFRVKPELLFYFRAG